MKGAVAIGFVLVSLLCSASAQERKPLIVGPARVSCGIFAGSAEPDKLSVVTWAQGFLSGMNTYRWLDTHYTPLVLPDAASIRLYLENYCRSNPLETPLKASIELYRELENRQ